MSIFTAAYATLATEVFLNPQPTYRWLDIVTGLNLNGRTLVAVANNTWRGFHRVNKLGTGAKNIFIPYFAVNPGPTTLIQQLAQVVTVADLDFLANTMCEEIRRRLLTGNIKPLQLGPNKYNKVRKPVDIYLEQLVSMATELTPHRARLMPLLRVPLDNWIFKDPILFTDSELRAAGLRRNSGFGELEHEVDYLRLQTMLRNLATHCEACHGVPFHPIYFDLLWGHRHTRAGGNLFELNPP